MNLTSFAKIISYLFVPPFLNLAIFIIYSLQFENPSGKIYSIISSLLFGVLLPITVFIKLRKKGKILNDDATIKEERTVPYIYGILFSMAALVLTALLKLNVYILLLWMIYLVCSILLININHFWKISAHTMGASIPLGASIILSPTFIYIFAIILIMVGFARYVLKVHTISQIIAGALVGFTTTYILLNLL